MTVHASGWWAQHGIHALLVAVPALAFALVGLGADVRSWWRRGASERLRETPRVMVAAAALSAAAALIHVGVCPEHFREGLIYGVFFAVSAGCQLGWAALVTGRYSGWMAPAGLLGNASIVLLWSVTRTVGIPLGPEAGEVERLGVLDLLCGACEMGVVALCALAIRQHVHPWRKRRRSDCATPSWTG